MTHWRQIICHLISGDVIQESEGRCATAPFFWSAMLKEEHCGEIFGGGWTAVLLRGTGSRTAVVPASQPKTAYN